MRTMIWRRVAIACCLFAPVAFAQPENVPERPSGELPSAENLFAAHVEAIGGTEKVDTHVSRRMSGSLTFEQTGDRAILRIAQDAPNKLYIKHEVPGAGSQQVWYDGSEGWQTQSMAGPSKVDGEGLKQLELSADFHGQANYANRYTSMKTIERGVFEGRRAWTVEVRTHNGLNQKIYFDVETSRCIGVDTIPDSDDSPFTRIIMAEYKDFDGVSYPTVIVQRRGEQNTIIRYRRITINVEDDQSYDAPQDVKDGAATNTG